MAQLELNMLLLMGSAICICLGSATESGNENRGLVELGSSIGGAGDERVDREGGGLDG